MLGICNGYVKKYWSAGSLDTVNSVYFELIFSQLIKTDTT